MNKHSSRCCVLQLGMLRAARWHRCCPGAGGKKVELVLGGLLTIDDMAGSERVKKTMSEGVRFNERLTSTPAFWLGNVVQALAAKRRMPYRESMLTKLWNRHYQVAVAPPFLCVPWWRHRESTALEFASVHV